jgi:hypothetical protein
MKEIQRKFFLLDKICKYICLVYRMSLGWIIAIIMITLGVIMSAVAIFAKIWGLIPAGVIMIIIGILIGVFSNTVEGWFDDIKDFFNFKWAKNIGNIGKIKL